MQANQVAHRARSLRPADVPRRGPARARQASRLLCLAAAVAVLSAPSRSLGECLRYEDFTHPMGVVETPDGQEMVAVSGTHAYVTGRETDFFVIDVEDPHSPRLAGRLDLGTYLFGVAALGSHAYLTAWYGNRLYVIDVSNPASPWAAGSIQMPGSTWGVAVVGPYVYVACADAGLQIVDVSDPQNPRIAGGVDTPSTAVGVAVRGGYAFVADWEDGLLVIDVSDPQDPRPVGSVDTPDVAFTVAVSGTFAYVGEWDDDYFGWTSDFCVIDIADPANPQLLGSIETGDVYSVAVSGPLACVTDSEAGLLVIDVTDPTNPSLVETITFPPYFISVGVAFAPTPISAVSTLYVSGTITVDPLSFTGCFLPVHVSAHPNPEPVSRIGLPCCPIDLAVTSSHAYIAEGSYGLQVVDITDLQSPTLAGAVDTPYYARDVTVSGQTAYVADGSSGVQVIDIADPETPRIVGSVDTPGNARAVAVSGTLAYAADQAPGLQVIDVLDPEGPEIIETVDTPGEACDVAISPPYAYVADGNGGLQVMDLTDPQSPRIVGSADTPGWAWNVVVSAGHAYLTSTVGLYVIDVSEPTSPQVVSEMEVLMSWAGDMALSGHHLYMTNGYVGVQVIDVSDPESPRNEGYMDVQRLAYGVAVLGSHVLVVDAEGYQHAPSLYVFPSQCEPRITHRIEGPLARLAASAPRVSAFPNPLNGETAIRLSLPASGRVRASVWDVGGRLVRTLHDGILPASRQVLRWDGRGGDGRPVAAGVYWVRVMTAAGTASDRLVVLR